MIIFYFSLKPYGVSPHLNRLSKMVQMRGHNMFLCRDKREYLVLIKDNFWLILHKNMLCPLI